MIVGTVNATEDQLWKWFTVPDTDAEVELRLVSRDELTALGKSTNLNVQAKYIAKHFFRDFKNFQDRNGDAIENTEENRIAVLAFRPLWAFVTNKLTDLGGWFDEGKGDSGSVS